MSAELTDTFYTKSVLLFNLSKRRQKAVVLYKTLENMYFQVESYYDDISAVSVLRTHIQKLDPKSDQYQLNQ